MEAYSSRMRHRSVWITAAMALLLWLAAAPERAIAVVSPLAVQVRAPEGPVAPEPGLLRSRLVAVNTATLPRPPRDEARVARQPNLTLELFPDVFVEAVFDRFDPSPAGVTWVGRVRGDVRSTVTLVYGDGRLTGSINTSAGTFAIRPPDADMRSRLGDAAATAHEIVEIDQSALPREAEPLVPDLTPEAVAAAAAAPMADSADVIDVLVVYTQSARNRWGGDAGLRQLIALGESETNTSYANAGITQRIRVVHTEFVPYQDISDFTVMLPTLRGGLAEGLEGVAALRDQHRADLVMLVVQPPSPNYCGIAYVMSTVSTAFAPSGYSVVHSTCISPGLTFAHELGHNMGAHHDWYVNSSTRPFTYAHGYVNPNPGQRWRTVMAYADRCTALGVSCRRLVSWSNPDLRQSPACDASTGYICDPRLWLFPGSAQGVAAGTRSPCPTGSLTDTECDADNRRTLNTTALTVANLRQATPATTTAHRR